MHVQSLFALFIRKRSWDRGVSLVPLLAWEPETIFKREIPKVPKLVLSSLTESSRTHLSLVCCVKDLRGHAIPLF